MKQGHLLLNSFQKDQYRIGTEYSYNDYFMAPEWDTFMRGE